MKKRHMMDHVAPRAVWDMLICSADDGNDDDGGGKDDDDDGGADDAVKKLTAKVDELLSEKKKLAGKVRDFEVAEAERKTAAAAAEEEAARKAKDWDKIEDGYKTKLSEKDGEALLWRSRYEERVIGDDLRDALDAVKVKPEMRKIVAAFLQNENAIEIGEDGKTSIDGKPLADFVKTWAATDEGKAFIINGSSGGDANGSGKGGSGDDGDNPWAPGKVNLTKQGEIFRKDPARAKALAAAAGQKVG
ncbi:MAG TPA: hypothetical protein PLR76_09935 [Hyphomonas sp.]|nr:hypothetical protein [Hyphomonas sp.]